MIFSIQVQVSLRVRKVSSHTLTSTGSGQLMKTLRLMNIVEVNLRPTRRGRPVTKCGRVTEIKPNKPNRVKTDINFNVCFV